MAPQQTRAALLALAVGIAPLCRARALQPPRDANAWASAELTAKLELDDSERPHFEVGDSIIAEPIDGFSAGAKVRCTVTGPGQLPDTYNLYSWFGPEQERVLQSVPTELLRRSSPEVQALRQRGAQPNASGTLAAAAEKEERRQEGQQPPEQREERQPLDVMLDQEDEALPEEAEQEHQQPQQDAGPDGGGAEEEAEWQAQLDSASGGGEGSEEEEGGAEDRLPRQEPSTGGGGAEPRQENSTSDGGAEHNTFWRELKVVNHHDAHEARKLARELNKRRQLATNLERRAAFRRQWQALAEQRKRKEAEEAARQAARRSLLAEAKKAKVHLTVNDQRGREVQFEASKSTGLRAVMVRAMARLALQPGEARFSKHGTVLDPAATIETAGLQDKDIIEVDQVATPAPRAAAAQEEAASSAASVKPPPPALRPGASSPKSMPRAAGARSSSTVEYEVGDYMEIKIEHTLRRLDPGKAGANWIPCMVTGKGKRLNTYNVHFIFVPVNLQDLLDVPTSVLRMVEAQDWARKIKRMREDPLAAVEAVTQASREADKRHRLWDFANRLSGAQANNQTADGTLKMAAGPGAQKRPLPPNTTAVKQGILPHPALGEKHPSLGKRH